MAYSNKVKVNPHSPIIHLKIGDTVITTANSPRQAQHFISMSVTESALDTYSDIVFTLYDDSALLLEYELKKGYNSVRYRFGADETSLCPERVCHIVDYDIEFQTGGMLLTLNCEMGEGLNIENDEKPKEYTGKISDIVAQCCTELGYKVGNIVETDDEPTETPRTTSGQDLLTFIKTLTQEAKSVNGESGYVTYTKDKDGEMYLYFEPIKSASFEDSTTYEFIIGQEHENIISFKPEYKGLLQYVVGNMGSSTDTTDTTNTDSSTIDNDSESSNDKDNANSSATYTITPGKMTRDNLVPDGGGSSSEGKTTPMFGVKMYAKNDTLKVYSGTDSTKCDVYQTLAGDDWFYVEKETAAWYYGHTYLYTYGWIRKVDCSIFPARLTDDDVTNNDDEDGYSYTDIATGTTSTGANISSNSDIMNKLGLVAPSLDELSNVLITPYKADSDFHRYIGSSSYNAEELGKVAEYMFTMASALQPTAQLELKGNALIDTQSFILMIVLTKDKLFHHSSGFYQIVEVCHNIELGEFTTTLNLLKRAMKIDDNGNITLLDVSEGVLSNNISGNGSDTVSTSTLSGGADSNTIKKYAEKYLGLPYVWGGSGANARGYDCSGFCSEMLYDMGYKRIGTTANFINTGEQVCPPWDKANIKPGDCLVYRQNGAGHVVMVVDQSTIVHAPRTGDVIKYADLDYYWNLMQDKNGKVMRYIGYDEYKRSDA